jgi:hypothetical protein
MITYLHVCFEVITAVYVSLSLVGSSDEWNWRKFLTFRKNQLPSFWAWKLPNLVQNSWKRTDFIGYSLPRTITTADPLLRCILLFPRHLHDITNQFLCVKQSYKWYEDRLESGNHKHVFEQNSRRFMEDYVQWIIISTLPMLRMRNLA